MNVHNAVIHDTAQNSCDNLHS